MCSFGRTTRKMEFNFFLIYIVYYCKNHNCCVTSSKFCYIILQLFPFFNEIMSNFRPLLLLIILTAGFWKYGDSCVRQKYANDKTEDHYEKLLEINTGYSHEQLSKSFAERESSSRWSVVTAIDDVYGKLLCSYLFNCSHYTNLIKPLLTAKGRNALNRLIMFTYKPTETVFFSKKKWSIC